MILALADGRGVAWFGLGLAISATTMTFQILVGLGKYEAHWPLWATSTKAGRVSAVALHGAFVLFCLVGLILAL